jgi:hypothetical protein
MKTTQKVEVSFTDAMGRTLFVRQFTCEASQVCGRSFDMISFTNGWYLLNIITKNGKTSVPVIVKH